MKTNINLLATCLFVIALLPPGYGQKNNKATDDLTQVFKGTPKGNSGWVPAIYLDWEKGTIERFGKASINSYYRKLKEDLRPHKKIGVAIPRNQILASLIKTNPEKAREIMLKALTAEPSKHQWSIINETIKTRDNRFIKPLKNIALNDPQSSDRAFAIKAIASYGSEVAKPILKAALFDDNQSIRLMAMELCSTAGITFGDIGILNTSKLYNPFRMYFMSTALARLGIKEKDTRFFRADLSKQLASVKKAKPNLIAEYVKEASHHANKPAAAMALFLLGDKKQAKSAVPVLKKVLLDQAKKPDVYHSPAFFLRTSIICCFQAAPPDRLELLESLFVETIDNYSPKKEMLLQSLAYSLGNTKRPEIIAKLASIRKIKTNNYDLYYSAASSLAKAKSKEAYPALVKLVSKGREPFARLSSRDLEKLTGLNAPRVLPPSFAFSLGMISSQGGNRKEFWQDWYEKNRVKMSLPDLGFRKPKKAKMPPPEISRPVKVESIDKGGILTAEDKKIQKSIDSLSFIGLWKLKNPKANVPYTHGMPFDHLGKATPTGPLMRYQNPCHNGSSMEFKSCAYDQKTNTWYMIGQARIVKLVSTKDRPQELKPKPEFSWVSGIAIDTRRDRLLALANRKLYELKLYENENTRKWKLISSVNPGDRHPTVGCLAYSSSDDLFYSMTALPEKGFFLLEIDSQGKLRKKIKLSTKLFYEGYLDPLLTRTQLFVDRDYVILTWCEGAAGGKLEGDVSFPESIVINRKTGTVIAENKMKAH